MNFYNAATDLIDRNLLNRADKIAYMDNAGVYSFGELARRVDLFAGYLVACGLPAESRILVALLDGIDFPTVCLGAMKAGIVPVMVNPLLPSADFSYMLADSRARMLVASAETWPAFAPIVRDHLNLSHILVSGDAEACGQASLAAALAGAVPIARPADTRPDEVCLWQYSSGSTGRPKGTMHAHGTIASLIELYPRQILGITEQDVTFSAAKLFFGYGFGNSLVFPLAAGATAILMAERPTPEAVWARIAIHRPTIFFGVPTLYNSMLASPAAYDPEMMRLRVCVSAGEGLPAEIGRQFEERFGVPVLNGLGSTEMFHMYISARAGDLDYETSGRPVEGYDIRLLDAEGREVPQGEVGELHVKGPTSALGYWCNQERSRHTFRGEWVRSGDTFYVNADGRYVFCGRSDDLMKVGGIYVSPMEVEGALIAHRLVREAAVVGAADEAGLVKPKAFVVPVAPVLDQERFIDDLKSHVKLMLAPYKYPRWIEIVDELPKTATGKIERYKLRCWD